jgi:hypothetical protein
VLRGPVVAPIRQPIDGEVPERSIGAVSKCVDSRPGASHLIPVSPVFCGLWLAGKSSRATQSRRVLWRPVPIWVPIPTPVVARIGAVPRQLIHGLFGIWR